MIQAVLSIVHIVLFVHYVCMPISSISLSSMCKLGILTAQRFSWLGKKKNTVYGMPVGQNLMVNVALLLITLFLRSWIYTHPNQCTSGKQINFRLKLLRKLLVVQLRQSTTELKHSKMPGYKISQNVFKDRAVVQRHLCPMCELVLKDAVQLPCCGHRCCESCVDEILSQRATTKCPAPQCGEQLAEENGKWVSILCTCTHSRSRFRWSSFST